MRSAVAAGTWLVWLSPLLLSLVVFEVYCLREINRSTWAHGASKWLWAVICLTSVPTGGLLYLALTPRAGNRRGHRHTRTGAAIAPSRYSAGQDRERVLTGIIDEIALQFPITTRRFRR